MSNFGQKGKPLDDSRLTLSNTTKTGAQQYRIWRDSQQILVPKGQSTTKPLQSENVQTNTGVHGYISKGYFNKPTVEFRNTTNFNLFDRFYLQTTRDILPLDDDDKDLHDDLGLLDIIVSIDLEFKADIFKGKYNKQTTFHYLNEKTWITDRLHFSDYNLQQLYGDFILITNPLQEHMEQGLVFNTGKFIQKVNLPIYAIVKKATIKNGNSKMPLLLQNDLYPVKLDKFEYAVLRGE